MEIGQNLIVKLFLSEGSELNTIETLVQVVWKDILSGEGREDYRAGVKLLTSLQKISKSGKAT
jgi:hypothetical protein